MISISLWVILWLWPFRNWSMSGIMINKDIKSLVGRVPPPGCPQRRSTTFIANGSPDRCPQDYSMCRFSYDTFWGVRADRSLDRCSQSGKAAGESLTGQCLIRWRVLFAEWLLQSETIIHNIIRTSGSGNQAWKTESGRTRQKLSAANVGVRRIRNVYVVTDVIVNHRGGEVCQSSGIPINFLWIFHIWMIW